MPATVAPGSLIGGRYKVEANLGSSDRSSVWRALDERLQRQVAIRVFAQVDDAQDLQHQIGVAASLTHPRVVRVFDTGYDSGNFYTVSELLPGSLAWAALPLSTSEALSVGADVAEALRYAHSRGVVHGNLHEGNVLLSEQGAKVGDFWVVAGSGPSGPARDLVALGSLIKRLAPPELPDPGNRELARIAGKLEAGAYPDAESALSDLRSIRPSQPRSVPKRSAVPVIVAGIALLGLLVAGATRLGARSTPTPAPSESHFAGDPHRIVRVEDFDPMGNDGREGRRSVARITDGDTATFWATERYSSAGFSGLKRGVGVIVDLGQAREVGRAKLLMGVEGCAVELRRSEGRARTIDGWDTVASVGSAGRTTSVDVRPSTSRWWLVWITRLGRTPGGRGRSYSCAVSEVGLYPP
ncbi:MAG TPA: protein kinase [Actinomycetota bacterium]|nr:protein kinase [Actinomycetota bacterium]